jgi:hypothetical protein
MEDGDLGEVFRLHVERRGVVRNHATDEAVWWVESKLNGEEGCSTLWLSISSALLARIGKANCRVAAK